MLEVVQIPVLKDNYIYLLHAQGQTIAIDAGVSEPVIEVLEARSWTLTAIWLTHHHWDHQDGTPNLVQRYGCPVYGARQDSHRLPALARALNEGDTLAIGQYPATVLNVHGHTLGHIAFWFAGEAMLFSGDTLFSMGCGRLFEGTPEQMWASLKKLRSLPDDTLVYCTHEYTLTNSRFALGIEPQNTALQQRAREVAALRALGKPTIPTTIALEKVTNPFLRADNPDLQAAIGMVGADSVAVFAHLREQRNGFQ